jgi:cell wall-associated NlpC family hydrolase
MVWSAVLSAGVAFAFANPVYAEPALPSTIPDTGARPTPAGAFQLPGAPAIPGATGPIGLPPGLNGPLAAQVYAKQTAVEALGEQLLQLRQNRDTALAELATAEGELRAADYILAQAQEAADSAATEALKEAAALPPGAFGSDLHGLGALSRIQKGEPSGGDTTAPARELARATAVRQAAYEKRVAAETRSQDATNQFATSEATYKRLEAELLKLRKDNATQLAAIERAQEAAEQKLGAQYLNNANLAGMQAHPIALAAVRYALAQLGDPYVWGTEGPNTFDCSGLTWAAYRSAGYFGLPRVAKDQYYATRLHEVPRTALLPGDLLFFASGSTWTSVYHMAMYIGGGKMVQAPTTGDVVKISTVPWSRLDWATRVVGAVPAPVTPPPATPPPRPTPPTTPPPAPTPPATTPPATPPTRPPHSPPPTRPPTTPPPSSSPPAGTTPASTPSVGSPSVATPSVVPTGV